MRLKLRKEVLKKYNSHCAYCGKLLGYKDMQIDHIKSKHAGGTDNIDNLNPSCRRCNHYKRAMSLQHFRETMQTLNERLQKPYINRVGLDYGIITIKPFDGLFYFEKEVKNE